MNIKTTFLAIIVATIVIGSSYVIAILTKNQYTKSCQTDRLLVINDSLRKEVDSLKQELYVIGIELNRFDYILDRAEEEISPDCMKQMDKIFKETE